MDPRGGHRQGRAGPRVGRHQPVEPDTAGQADGAHESPQRPELGPLARAARGPAVPPGVCPGLLARLLVVRPRGPRRLRLPRPRLGHLGARPQGAIEGRRHVRRQDGLRDHPLRLADHLPVRGQGRPEARDRPLVRRRPQARRARRPARRDEPAGPRGAVRRRQGGHALRRGRRRAEALPRLTRRILRTPRPDARPLQGPSPRLDRRHQGGPRGRVELRLRLAADRDHPAGRPRPAPRPPHRLGRRDDDRPRRPRRRAHHQGPVSQGLGTLRSRRVWRDKA